MFRTLDDFTRTWGFESAATVKTFEHLTDASLSTAIDADHRTLGRLANHLIETLSEMPRHMGLPLEEQPSNSATAADLVADYKKRSDALLAAIGSEWTDATLGEMRNMYGEQWSVADTLHALVMHQAHHRGQMTVLMRQAGLQVPGVYGPSKDDWASMGRPPLD